MRQLIAILLGILILVIILLGVFLWWFKPAPLKLGPPVPVIVSINGVSTDIEVVELEARLDKILVTANIGTKERKTTIMLPVGGHYLLTANGMKMNKTVQSQSILISITSANQVIRLYFDDWSMSGMLSVNGRDIRTGQHAKINLRGFGLPNAVYNEMNPAKLTGSDYEITSADYKAIKDSGANVARFYLQYYWMSPQNEQSLYAYLDKQIAAARRQGIYLILNLHFFGHSEDVAKKHEDGFWQGDIAGKGYDLVSFWDRLSKRYHYESIIAGYDLINEPNCAEGYLEPLLYDEYEKIINVIRANGDQHMIFLSDPVQKFTNPNGQTYFPGAPFKKMKDSNIVYEYHFYQPIEFTHQGFFESSYFERGTTYPYLKSEATYKGGFYNNPSWKDTVNGDWQAYKGAWVDIEKQANCTIDVQTDRFNINLSAAKTIGKVWFDDIILEEKDKASGKIRRLNINNSSLTLPKDYWGWQKDPFPSPSTSGWYALANPESEGVVFSWDRSQDHTGNGGGALLIDGTSAKWSKTNAWARWAQDGGARTMFYPIERGKLYRVRAWVKINGDNDYHTNLAFSISKVKETMINKQYLASFIKNYYESWGQTNNVPLFMGEFGVTNPSRLNIKGVPAMKIDDQVAWLSDVLEIVNQGYTKNWCFHAYKSYALRGDLFGLFDKEGPDTTLQKVIQKGLQ